jgi:hypothetical protein
VVSPVFNEMDVVTDQEKYTPRIKQCASVKQVRVDGCHYQISELQIRSWLENYGVVQGDIIEEAFTDDYDKTTIGTGSYLVGLKLSKRLPNWVPMFGMKVKLSYKGGRMACG